MYLFCNNEGRVIGTLGLEWLRFEYEGREVVLGFSNNYHAIEGGAGGLLYMQWMKSSPVGIVFGGSEDTHAILRQQKWTYYPGVKTYLFNWPYEMVEEEASWRKAAKAIARKVRHKRIDSYASKLPPAAAEVEAVEQSAYTRELLPSFSPFRFRFAPSLSHLGWRYALNLPFVRYRLFQIFSRSAPMGYVVLNDLPDRILVAQSDGPDAEVLAYGILRALLRHCAGDTRPRTALLTTSHPVMQRVYEQCGFIPARQERPFVLGVLRGKPDIDLDTSNWHINFDIGDNGLRYPFTS
jgi:hypothetical protein